MVLFVLFCVGHRINPCFSVCCFGVSETIDYLLDASQATLANLVRVDL